MSILTRIFRFIKHYVGGFYARAFDDHVFLHASGLAFSIIICLLPLILVLFSVLGILLETPHLADRVSSFLSLAIPYPRYAAIVKEFVFERVGEFRFYKNVTGPIGLVGLFLAASGLFSSMRTILHKVFRIPPGSWVLLSKMRDLGLVLLALVYFLLIAAVMPVSEYLAGLAREASFLERSEALVVSRAIIRFASFLILLVAFVLLFRFVPRERLPGRVIFVSAVSTSALWFTAQALFGIYIANAITLKEVYGAYLVGTAAVLWIYAASMVFIMGAEIGQLYWERLEAGMAEKNEVEKEDGAEVPGVRKQDGGRN